MTILACFDFSLAEIESSSGRDKCQILLLADGRISAGSIVIVDTAPKIWKQTIQVIKPDGEILTKDIAIGYAGASALVALSVLGFTSHVFQFLNGEDFPSIDQVATFLGEALRASLAEYRQNHRTDESRCAFLVCGFNERTRTAEARQIVVHFKNDSHSVEIRGQNEACIVVAEPPNGNLSNRLHERLADSRGAEAEELVVSEVEEFAREHSVGMPFGGQLQVARIGTFGVELAAVRVWDKSFKRADLPPDWNEGDYRNLMLGYDVFDLRVGQCDFVPQHYYQLPDADRTSWAKGPLVSEPRGPDDGDLFSRPRTGVVYFNR